MRFQRLFVPALVATLVACGGGGGTPEELRTSGIDKMSAGDFEGAVAALEQAKQAAAGTPLEMDITKELAEARVHTDPSEAVVDFLELAESHPDAVSEEDYLNIGRQLSDSDQIMSALAVVEAGIKRFGETESPKLMAMIDKFKQQAANNTELKSALESLGYL
ncbi:MAG: hypothetical protein AAFZ65_09025 [Planctomycetota bacterium]